MDVFTTHESNVRSYIRAFPEVFTKAEGARLTGRSGRTWIDFFAGAGALNYGHNDPDLRDALIAYLAGGGVVHSLDMATEAKEAFITAIQDTLLAPRGLAYKLAFPGPTGTNAVEAALKIARKATGRAKVISFTNAFHGMTLGSLALTGNGGKRAGAGVPLPNVVFAPYDGYLGDGVDTLAYLDKMLSDGSSGLDLPAAVVVESVQGEGGINAASPRWLSGLAAVCARHGVLLIVDDIQAGCGRTGPFFSFEPAGLQPDIVCLSKSLSGFGLPASLVLVKPELDVFSPGEHNGTFRGHNPAFVTGTAALAKFWRDDALERAVADKARSVAVALAGLARAHPELGAVARGRGLMQGLALADGEAASEVCRECFERGLIVETSGAGDEVVKLLPPLTISAADLDHGLAILADAVAAVAARTAPRLAAE